MLERWQTGGFGLYVHWPFCQAKCPYCDFNSHVVASIDQDRWKAAYLAEIDRVSIETPGRVIQSIYFGGGTPSLMDPKVVASVIDCAKSVWQSANDLEITLEANPTSVEANRFSAYREGGVNRVSLGLQALNDVDLKTLGRLHSADEGKAALDLAQSIFDRVSFDLIYARQNQTLEDWQAELTTAISFGAQHMSLYQLTIEGGTAFGDRFARGKLPGLPDEDLAADMFNLTQALMDEAGLYAYEISNHARDGDYSRHNRIYWKGGDYAGIGPGAHGRLTLSGQRYATSTPLDPACWLKRVEDIGNGEEAREILSDADDLEERLMMGLRLDEGVTFDRPELFGFVQNKLNEINVLQEQGLLWLGPGSLRVTRRGRPLLNAILRELLA